MKLKAKQAISAYSKGRYDAKKGRDFLPCGTNNIPMYAKGYENPDVPYKVHSFIGTDKLKSEMEKL